jgi:3'(2'), 5'-bisphosphate nucleotidase
MTTPASTDRPLEPTPSLAFQHELAVALAAARAAAAAITPLFRRAGLTVHDKSGESGPARIENPKHALDPVSEADLLADRIIVDELTAAFPGDGVITEERAHDGAAFTHSRIWCIDPIDGTREFVTGVNEFAIQIGLMIDRKPVLGVLCAPARNEIAWGVVGPTPETSGAFAAPYNTFGEESTPRRLTVSAVANPSEAIFACSRFHKGKLLIPILQQMGASRLLERGSVGLKVLAIATGEADALIHTSAWTKWWDSLAPVAVLLAAGGAATDAWGGSLRYEGSEIRHRRGLIFTNPTLLPVLAQAIGPMLPDSGTLEEPAQKVA